MSFAIHSFQELCRADFCHLFLSITLLGLILSSVLFRNFDEWLPFYFLSKLCLMNSCMCLFLNHRYLSSFSWLLSSSFSYLIFIFLPFSNFSSICKQGNVQISILMALSNSKKLKVFLNYRFTFFKQIFPLQFYRLQWKANYISEVNGEEHLQAKHNKYVIFFLWNLLNYFGFTERNFIEKVLEQNKTEQVWTEFRNNIISGWGK